MWRTVKIENYQYKNQIWTIRGSTDQYGNLHGKVYINTTAMSEVEIDVYHGYFPEKECYVNLNQDFIVYTQGKFITWISNREDIIIYNYRNNRYYSQTDEYDIGDSFCYYPEEFGDTYSSVKNMYSGIQVSILSDLNNKSMNKNIESFIEQIYFNL